MISILDNTTLDDYITNAEMEDTEVEVRRVQKNDLFLIDSSNSKSSTVQTLTVKDFNFEHLLIPRKPKWTKTMTAEEVDRREKDSFLEWRRGIASLEANISVLNYISYRNIYLCLHTV